jgi:hypothetical protein
LVNHFNRFFFLLLVTRGSGEDTEGTPVTSLDTRNAEGTLQSGTQALGQRFGENSRL